MSFLHSSLSCDFLDLYIDGVWSVGKTPRGVGNQVNGTSYRLTDKSYDSFAYALNSAFEPFLSGLLNGFHNHTSHRTDKFFHQRFGTFCEAVSNVGNLESFKLLF